MSQLFGNLPLCGVADFLDSCRGGGIQPECLLHITDLRAANEHYAQYEGKVQDAAQKVNDAYLKAFSEESGVQSYGEVADLLIAWYLQKTA